MANSNTSDTSPQRFRRGTAASELLRDVSFPTAVRGYDRRAVDEFLEELRNLVADLEARQTREGVVQKALDELGEETASILQRAHETADEIAARSRAQADGRLQRAEREAEIVKRDADEYAEQVVVDTRLLWDERQRLIEDIRHLADEVLGTADDAMERLKLPEPIAAAERDESTTSEASVTPIPHPLSVAPAEPEDESDPGVPYDLEAPEEDPDATVAWSIEPGEQDDPDATRPYAVDDEYVREEDPDPTAPWAIDHEQGEPVEGAGEQPEDEGGDPGTVELEALPGGNNTDDQAAEHERKPD
jgi:DivIVA domain-containing protein